MMAYPSRRGQFEVGTGNDEDLSETPEQPEDGASPQDMDLEAQLDDLLNRLEEVDPETVPADLRKNPPAEPVAPEPIEAQAAEEPEPVEGVQVVGEASVDEPAPTDPGSQGQGLDLESIASMASDLLNQQIDATIESSAGDADPKVSSAPDSPTDSESAQAPEPAVVESAAPESAAVEASKPEPLVPLGEDDLASQIQGLLNEVQTQGAGAIADKEPAAAVAEEAPSADESQAVAEDVVDESTDVKTPTAAVEPAEAAGVEAGASDPDPNAGAVSIDQIDAMLADSAEQAIEHGPAPATDIPPGTDEVLAAQAKAEQEAEARAKADRDAAELPGAQTSEPQPEPEPVAESVAEPVAVEPQPVEAIGASAEDVAKELDEEAQPAAVAVPADELAEPVSAETAFADEPQAGEVVIRQSRLKKAERRMLQICGRVNRPLSGLSPEMRDTVGYAGVLTTAVAMFMVLYGVLF